MKQSLKKSFIELFLFIIVMVTFSFFTSYFTDLLTKSKIDWIPKHAWSMTTGITFTTLTVYILFINYVRNYFSKGHNS